MLGTSSWLRQGNHCGNRHCQSIMRGSMACPWRMKSIRWEFDHCGNLSTKAQTMFGSCHLGANGIALSVLSKFSRDWLFVHRRIHGTPSDLIDYAIMAHLLVYHMCQWDNEASNRVPCIMLTFGGSPFLYRFTYFVLPEPFQARLISIILRYSSNKWKLPKFDWKLNITCALIL